MQVRSANQSHFAQIPQIKRPRSSFKRISRHKHTFDEGWIIPFYLDEVLPGDTFNVKAGMFARLATPIFPIMDNMKLETFWFYCPNRLVWDNFVKQQGERTDPDDTTDYTTPVMDPTKFSGITVGDLWDNFGLPMQGQQYLDKISALPFRMYNLIFNTWFRDQDLQDSLPVPKGNGPDDLSTTYALQRINKYKDYFTIARPAPQKGPAVELPIGGTADITGKAPVTGIGIQSSYGFGTSASNVRQADLTTVNMTNSRLTSDPVWNIKGTANPGYPDIWAEADASNSTLSVDLNSATGPTINALRELITVQQVYELDMRGGSRFIEMIFNHFGVINPDFRLQNPEFLGHMTSPLNIHPVPQTGETDATPQGNLAAFGTVSSHQNGFLKTFTEHGYVFGFVAVRADQTYQYGLDRHWSRQTRFDYYLPIFANLGEQAILNQELWVNPAAATGNETVFGYQEHWAEYRYKTSKITGLFRSTAPQSLDAWGLWQEFNALPVLNEEFIQENAPVDRVIAVDSEPHFIFDCVVENNTARVMPMYSQPGLFRL